MILKQVLTSKEHPFAFIRICLVQICWYFFASVVTLAPLSPPDRPDESHDTAVLQEGESSTDLLGQCCDFRFIQTLTASCWLCFGGFACEIKHPPAARGAYEGLQIQQRISTSKRTNSWFVWLVSLFKPNSGNQILRFSHMAQGTAASFSNFNFSPLGLIKNHEAEVNLMDGRSHVLTHLVLPSAAFLTH